MSKKLIKALAKNKYDIANKIIASKHFELPTTDAFGRTALHLAARQGYADILSRLTEFGFDKEARDNDGESPLHAAVAAKHLKCTSMLLSLGSEVNAADKTGQTPLHLAVQNNTYQIVRLLVQNNANIDAKDHDLQIPIDYAVGDELSRIRSFLEEPYNDSDASDTDSEDELGYQYSDYDSLIEQMETLSIEDNTKDSKSNVFAHYRGLHFYQEHFTRKQRGEIRAFNRAQEMGEIQRLGIYSGATHEKAKVSLSVPSTDKPSLEVREKKLVKANETVIIKVSALQSTGCVTPCLGTSSASRQVFDSRYVEYTQRYVNSYQSLIGDMAQAPDRTTDKRSSERTVKKWSILKEFGFTKLPFVSTSEDVSWGMEYATAMLNWDKAGTHRPRTNPNITVLTPMYQADGHCRFPYLGILYVTMHSKNELSTDLSTRILDLFSQDQVDLNAGPGGHAKSGYVRARERVFIGGIDGGHVKLSREIRVPNFYYTYREFMEEKYGMDELTYNKFKNKLATYGAIMPTGRFKNKNELFRTEQKIIQHVIDKQKEIIEKNVAKLAEVLGLRLAYVGVDSNKYRTSGLPDISEFEEKRTQTKAARP
jgi:hypothetical protein